MCNFKVVEVRDHQWSNIINKCLSYDFYHTQAYNLLEKVNKPVLFTLYFNEELIAIPLIIRQIPDSEWLDCTSAYGYCGPISTIDMDLIPNEYITKFQEAMLNYFSQNNIISTFSRLHPLISTGNFFNNF